MYTLPQLLKNYHITSKYLGENHYLVIFKVKMKATNFPCFLLSADTCILPMQLLSQLWVVWLLFSLNFHEWAWVCNRSSKFSTAEKEKHFLRQWDVSAIQSSFQNSRWVFCIYKLSKLKNLRFCVSDPLLMFLKFLTIPPPHPPKDNNNNNKTHKKNNCWCYAN